MNARLVIAALAAGVLLAGGCASAPGVGERAPAFTGEDSGGNPVSLASYAGSVLILDFWAVW